MELNNLSFVGFGQRFKATSPNGRFVDGAAAINGYVLSHIEAHGKNIFYVHEPNFKTLSLFMILLEEFGEGLENEMDGCYCKLRG